MSPWVIAAALAAFVASNVAVGAFMYGAGGDACKANQTELADTVREVQAAAQQGAASAIAAQQPINRTIVQKATHEVQTNTVYRDCRAGADGVRLANEALTGRRPEPAGGVAVPGAVAAE